MTTSSKNNTDNSKMILVQMDNQFDLQAACVQSKATFISVRHNHIVLKPDRGNKECSHFAKVVTSADASDALSVNASCTIKDKNTSFTKSLCFQALNAVNGRFCFTETNSICLYETQTTDCIERHLIRSLFIKALK